MKRRILEGAVAHGHIDVRGKTDEQIGAEIAAYFSASKGNITFSVAIDHTENLRNLGRTYENQGQYDIAVLFYATWVEHVLNGIISIATSRKKIRAEYGKQIVRDLALSAKLGWLMPVLGHREINLKHANCLRRLAEYRNQFVHYKWTHTDFHAINTRKDDLAQFLKECRKSITYLAKYQSSESLSNSRAKLHRVAKKFESTSKSK